MLSLYPLLALSMAALLLGALLGIVLEKWCRGIAALKGLMASFARPERDRRNSPVRSASILDALVRMNRNASGMSCSNHGAAAERVSSGESERTRRRSSMVCPISLQYPLMLTNGDLRSWETA